MEHEILITTVWTKYPTYRIIKEGIHYLTNEELKEAVLKARDNATESTRSDYMCIFKNTKENVMVIMTTTETIMPTLNSDWV